MGCCWYWIACKDKDGYGIFKLNGKGKRAHRLSYEDKFGKIPEELVINHICRNRKCVNADHLEVITNKENVQIGENAQRNKTHCLQGHEYSEENTYIAPSGFRQCNICRLNANRQCLQRKKNSVVLLQ